MAEKETIVPDKSGYLEIEDNQKIYWEYFGNGEKEALCLLNGLAMKTESWYSFLQYVHPEYDIILYDYLGQGKSSCEDRSYSITAFAGYLSQIMDHLGIDKIHAMGISYGGFIGAEFARLFPQKLHTLTISGILLDREVSFDLYHELSIQFYTNGPKAFEIYTHFMYEKIFAEPFLRKFLDKLPAMRKRFYENYIHRLHCLVRLTEAQTPHFAQIEEKIKQWKKVRIPVLVLAGRDDRAVPIWMQKKIPSILPHCRYLEIPDCGHMVYMEETNFFFRTLRSFMHSKKVIPQ